MKPARTQTFEPLWNIRDLARYAGVSERTVYGWIERGDMEPGVFLRVGRALRFERAKVLQWFRNRAESA